MAYAKTPMEQEILHHLQHVIDELAATYTDYCSGQECFDDTVARQVWVANTMMTLTDIKDEIKCGKLFKMHVRCPHCGYTGNDMFTFPQDRCGVSFTYGCPKCRSLF